MYACVVVHLVGLNINVGGSAVQSVRPQRSPIHSYVRPAQAT